MAWAIWLLVPVAATALAALVAWWRSRPKRPPGTEDAMRAHSDFLDALSRTPRAKDRGLRSD